MGALQKLFAVHGSDYLKAFGTTMPTMHKKVLAAMIACRTPQAGALLCACEACRQPHLLARSCGNRHCPTCQGAKAFAWLARQIDRALPTHHFMLTFTVPEPLRAFLRSNQRIGYAALFAASSGAIRTLAREPRFKLGDSPGFFGVLHTWGRTLTYHPHIHYVVPGGALSSQDRQWHGASPGFFLPVRALSVLFRAKFRAAMDAAGLLAEIPDAVWTTAWNVNCQPVGDAANTLAYLARYVFKVAISDQRILSVEDDHVRFAYTKPGSARRRTMALPVQEFIRRFLQHVLPTGFTKVRHYGFLSPNFRVPIAEIKARVEIAHAFAAKPINTDSDAPTRTPMACVHCGGVLKLLRVLRPAKPSIEANTHHAVPAALGATRCAAGP